MTQTQLILGPPGTGKTTRLLNLIDSYLSKGIEPSEIGFISFTKKSVNEARDRASVRFNIPINSFSYFRTIHSLAFRQLTMSSSQVMQRKHYQELGDIMGMKMSGIHRQDQMVFEMAIGDQLVFIESLARLMCKSLKETWSDLNSDISIEELDYFQRSLVKYKKANILFDFTDMLVRYYQEGHKPELKVLFVDEAQDLCQLQWRIVKQMVESSDITYIAGDDDQAIFRWSGADVDYFLKLPKDYEVNTTILKQSYRLPATIHKFSSELVIQIEDRNEKEFKPTTEKGSIQYVGEIEDVDLSSGEWLILVRNGYMISEIVDHIRSCGYPYETSYYSITEDEPLKAAIIWEKLRAGKSMLVSDLRLMTSYMSINILSNKIKARDKEDLVSYDEYANEVKLPSDFKNKIWYDVLGRIPDENREFYIAARRQGETLNKKPRIKVSTIHGAKGGEADNVVLFTDMSLKTYNNMVDRYDDELRVFYVGVTRAKKNLYIVQPKTMNYFTI